MKLNKKNVVVLTGLLGAATIAGTVAYYSGFTEIEENQFNIVAGQKGESGTGTILEPNWDPDSTNALQPNMTVPKDPQLKSDAAYDTWVFMRVEMPTVSAQVEGEDAETVHDAFNYVVNEGWELIEVENSGQSDTAGTDSVYIYAYTKPLAPGETTPSLFDEMTVPDYIKLSENLTDSVDISAAMIQMEGFTTYSEAAQSIFETFEDKDIKDNVATLKTGKEVNAALKRLAGNENAISATGDHTIKSIQRSSVAPSDGIITENLATKNDKALLAWFDSGTGTIYYYTDTNGIRLPKDSSYMFAYMYELTDIEGIEDFDTSNVTNMESFFNGCEKLQTIDLSNWKTNKVENMRFLLYSCKALTGIGDLSGWNTANVKDMMGLFGYCMNLSEINGIENWNTENVTNMMWTFTGCSELVSLNLENWSTKNVTNLSSMFFSCSNLETVGNIDNWDISNVSTFSMMFMNCPAETPNWNGTWNNGTFVPA